MLKILDIDECRDIPGICRYGRCRNTDGGFICECDDGYEPGLGGKTCIRKLKGFFLNIYTNCEVQLFISSSSE